MMQSMNRRSFVRASAGIITGYLYPFRSIMEINSSDGDKLSKVMEIGFLHGENRDLAQSLFGTEYLTRNKYTHCVYVDDKKPVLILGYGSLTKSSPEKELRLGYFDDFRYILDKYKPQSIKELTFIIDLYSKVLPHSNDSDEVQDNFNQIMNLKFPSRPIVDEILEDTNGLLLWRYELEALLQVFRCNTKPRIGFSYLTNTELWDYAQKQTTTMKLGDRLSLKDIMEERKARLNGMTFSYVHDPNIEGAMVLHDLLL